MTVFTSSLFAFFVLLGFSLCSGMFILSPVSDKENKLRHLLNFIGMKSISYYVGNFLADVVLFIIPTIGFIILLFPLDVKYFIMNGSWALLLAMMISFGVSMITLTYLFSFLFTNANNAFKTIGVIFLIGGSIVPAFIGDILGFVTEMGTGYKIFRYVFILDPFWNF
jgi:hypothetical protein